MASTSSRAHLSMVDYIVMAAMLVISLVIGFYFACTGGRQQSQREYLLAEGKMSFWPVCLSLFATFQSAIGILGIPADVYEYGTMMFFYCLGIATANFITAFTIVPLFHPLRLVSVYQYLEMRFCSKTVRSIGVFIGILSSVIYMALALLSPGLAIAGVTDIPIWMSVVVVAAIGTVYTAVGGMKSVLWTDVFQTAVIFAGLIAVIVKGVLQVGGAHEMYNIARKGDRLVFDDVSADPRVRHTVWGFIIGHTSFWIALNVGQSSIQRVSSTKSLWHARLAFLTALPMNITYGAFLTMTGLCMYAYFMHAGCDPLRAGHVSSSNQVIIYYVVSVFGSFPGISGLYVSTILSGSLSTLSSGLNSLAANTVEDLLRQPLSRLSPKHKTTITKIIALLYGCMITGVAYSMRFVQGPVTQVHVMVAITILGACSGPLAGLFVLGMVFPQANKIGAISGSVLATGVSMWICLGAFLYGACTPKKPPGAVYGCSDYNSTLTAGPVTTTAALYLTETSDIHGNDSVIFEARRCESSSGFYLYNVSYLWYTLIGCLVCVITGVVVSLITNRFTTPRYPPPQLLLPQVRRLVAGQSVRGFCVAADKPEVKKMEQELHVLSTQKSSPT